MKTKLSSKGQIILPAHFRRQDDIRAGQEFEVHRLGRGKYQLIQKNPNNSGLVNWLLSCPEKDFFVPIESESTDSL